MNPAIHTHIDHAELKANTASVESFQNLVAEPVTATPTPETRALFERTQAAAENAKRDVGGLLERFGSTNRRLEQLEGEVRVSNLMRFSKLENRIDEAFQLLNAWVTKLNGLETRHENLCEGFKAEKNKQDALSKSLDVVVDDHASLVRQYRKNDNSTLVVQLKRRLEDVERAIMEDPEKTSAKPPTVGQAAELMMARQPEKCGICGICGFSRVLIRPRVPGGDKRPVCPTCLAERMDTVREVTSTSYGVAQQEAKP